MVVPPKHPQLVISSRKIPMVVGETHHFRTSPIFQPSTFRFHVMLVSGRLHPYGKIDPNSRPGLHLFPSPSLGFSIPSTCDNLVFTKNFHPSNWKGFPKMEVDFEDVWRTMQKKRIGSWKHPEPFGPRLIADAFCPKWSKGEMGERLSQVLGGLRFSGSQFHGYGWGRDHVHQRSQ